MKNTIIENMVNNEILVCQSYLVEELLKKEFFSYEDIENLYVQDGEDWNCKEIYEWWSVTGWLAEKLKSHDEPVIDNDFGCWWGRCTTGQAIKMDWIIDQIAKDLNGDR